MRPLLLLFTLLTAPVWASEVSIDLKALGKSLGGWDGRKEKYAQYEMDDNRYRTFKPTVTQDRNVGRARPNVYQNST